MFAIGRRKCSTKNKQFGGYGSLGKIDDTKEEWWNQGANPILVDCIPGQSLQYVGDKLLENMLAFYKSLGVPSFDQVIYEANISTNTGESEFACALAFTMNGFKTHLMLIRMHYCMLWDGCFKFIRGPAPFKKMHQNIVLGES
ncbi:hypothetical protein O181_077148 [Austropuccinia psidii MF-1]|uniref:Tet-like 2OG-Fe(II) oxygenase domain-containing protein n=1 Tax=Austropuccinia psidii MF-1 TaxID=1389203 RepID=A0A9Q3FGE6_9BASI|nr:hypothetical protein [Austropuccinia psidii MF-1]